MRQLQKVLAPARAQIHKRKPWKKDNNKLDENGESVYLYVPQE